MSGFDIPDMNIVLPDPYSQESQKSHCLGKLSPPMLSFRIEQQGSPVLVEWLP